MAAFSVERRGLQAGGMKAQGRSSEVLAGLRVDKGTFRGGRARSLPGRRGRFCGGTED